MQPHLLSEKTEISISLLLQLFSTCYIAVQIKNYLKSTSVITMKNTDDFRYTLKEAISVQDEWNTNEECIARTAVYRKAPLHLKRCQTVNKSSL